MVRVCFYLFLLQFLHSPAILGQDIKCNCIDFTLLPISSEDTAFVDFKYRLKISMNISISNIENDTLVLKTNVKIAQGLAPENLEVFLVKNKNEIILLHSYIEYVTGNQPLMDMQKLTVVLPTLKNSELIVSYDVIGTGLFLYLFGQNYPNVLAYYPREEYVYPMNIPINKVRVTAPNNMLIFCGLKNNFNVKNGEVNLTFINLDGFKKESTNFGNIQLNTFIPDSIVNNTIHMLEMKKLYSYVDKLSTYLQTTKAINLIYVRWRDEKSRSAFGVTLGNHSVYDVNFSAKDILHEAIHQAFPSDIMNMSDGEYFIKESIIEWLALFLSEQSNMIDTTFKSTSKYCLFNAHVNNFEVWPLIYFEGPAILQKVANKTSEKLLASTIFSFLIEKENKLTTYDEFISFLRFYLPNNIVDDLDCMVKKCGEINNLQTDNFNNK